MLLGSLVLAAVLATAGVAKLRDRAGSREAMVGFGVPAPLAAPLGVAVPVAELSVAVALALGPARTWGALGALILLAGFSLAIAWNLARGRIPDCHCFGQLHSSPAGPRALARNVILIALAGLVATQANPALTALAASAGFALSAAGWALSRRAAPADSGERSVGLAIGSVAPSFELATLAGYTASLESLLGVGKPALLVFSDPHCGPCQELAPDVAEWQRSHSDELTIAVIERRDGSMSGPAVDEHGRRDVLLQRGREVAESYRAQGTPSAVLVSDEGRIASAAAAGGPAIEALVAETVPGFESGGRLEPAAPLAPPLVRRELLTRAVAAWAGIAGFLSAPAWATEVELQCRHERCKDRCCPKKAKCRRVGKRRVCVCPDGRPACGNRCCPDTFVCRRFRRKRRLRRRCVCPDGHVVCAGRCVRTRTDPRQCGRCGNRCPPATSCVGGECVGGDGSGSGPGGAGACECPTGEACCEGQCTDLNTNEDHCGMCGLSCPEGQACCEGVCRDLQTDPRNCGDCGTRCARDEVCSEGECGRRCRGGFKNCKGRCVDTLSNDPSNCGECGRKCSGPFDTGECCGGDCCDYNADTCCPGGCKNLAFDDENCGACGNVCGPNEFCRFGVCTCPLGNEC